MKIDALTINEYISLKERVAKYVKKIQSNPENELPSFSKISKRFKINYKEIEQICEDSDHLSWNIGVQIGLGGGQYVEKNKSDYTVEYSGEEK